MTTTLMTAGLMPAMRYRFAAMAARTQANMALMHRRVVGRRELLAMDERMLRDIGISRYEAIVEGAKPWWMP